MSEDFATWIKSERERLSKQRDEMNQMMIGCQRELAEIDREFAAIDAYEAAKKGKPAQQAKVGDGGTAGTKRARRGSIRDNLLNIISAAPAGMSRGEIINHLGIKGDKGREMSVSNALTALIRTEQVYREGGKYHAAATQLREAAE